VHIFLTGAIQVGKSTVVRKTLSLLNLTYQGFRTGFSSDRSSRDRQLYMWEASGQPVFEDAHCVAQFSGGAPPRIFCERFNSLGVQFLTQAQQQAQLIVMDECGGLEQEATEFQQKILEILDGGIPVLGVVKLSSKGWVDKIRNHQNVRLVTVDTSNRSALPQVLFQMFR
jgi:nucleoside-triphosphatase